MTRFHVGLIGSLGLLSFSASSHAVIVAGGDGTQNTVGPAALGQPLFSRNVGYVYGGSGVYLGNGYVLAAVHTTPSTNGAGDIVFPSLGLSFSAQTDGSGSIVPGQRLLTDGEPSDIAIYRLKTNPVLAPIVIGSSTGTNLTLVGGGNNRQAGITYYNVTNIGPNQVFNEQATASGSNASGYKYDAGRSVRYGSNTIETIDLVADDPGDPTTLGVQTRRTADFTGGGRVTAFFTDFDNVAGEAQGAVGDSGGGVFNTNGELIGMIDAVTAFTNQPNLPNGGLTTALFGNGTFAADLTLYKAQIDAIVNVPEPTSLGLLALSGYALLRRTRR